MSPRFAYFYFMSGDSDRVRATVPRHVAHWSGLGLNDYLGGPFENRTADRSRQHPRHHGTQRAVETDPFVLEGLVGSHGLTLDPRVTRR